MIEENNKKKDVKEGDIFSGIVDSDLDDKLIENVEIRDLIDEVLYDRKMTPYRWAKAIKYYEDHVLTPQKQGRYGTNYNSRVELAKVFHMSESAIKRYKQIMKLIPELQLLTDDASFPYTNIIGLGRYSEKVQQFIYQELVGVIKKEGIKNINKKLIDEIINKYTNNSKMNDQKNKLCKVDDFTTFSGRPQLSDEDGDITMFSWYTDGEGDEDSDIILFTPEMFTRTSDDEMDISAIPYMKEELSAVKAVNETDQENYRKIIYHLNYISRLSDSISYWSAENKNVVLQQIQQLIERISEERI